MTTQPDPTIRERLRELVARLEANHEGWADVAVAFTRAIGGEPHDAGLRFFSDLPVLLASPPRGTRLVLMGDELAESFVTRTDRGERLSLDWREPDENGWYEPTLTATDDGKTIIDRATLDTLGRRVRAAEGALRKAAIDWVWVLYARDQHDNEGHALPAVERYMVRRWTRYAEARSLLRDQGAD